MANDKDASGDKPVVINKWDGSACKNAIDDAVKDVLTEKFNYDECYKLIDIRLVICTLAVGVAGFALVWDFFYPFPKSGPILITCVSSYFILMGVLTLYTTYVEKGIFVVATQNDSKGKGNLWEASSCMKKFDDRYLLTLSCKDAKTGKTSEVTSNRSVADFINENGGITMETIEPEVVKLVHHVLSSKKDK